MEIVVGASPGGSGDSTARLIQKIFKDERLVNASTTVLNKAGGGGTISRIYLNQHSGDAHFIAIAPLNMLTNYITGVSQQPYTDVTPLAHLFDEYIAFAVRSDSPVRTGRDLVELLKRNPESWTIAIATTLGNPNHIAAALLMKAIGGDVRKLKTVVFNSAGEATTALLGGHVDLVPASVPVLLPNVRAGKIRIVALTSAERLAGFMADTPTWKEQGVDVVFGSWRGIVGPRGLSPGQIAYWDQVFLKLSQSTDWARDLDANYWANSYRNSRETRDYWEAQSRELRTILTNVGLAKKQ